MRKLPKAPPAQKTFFHGNPFVVLKILILLILVGLIKIGRLPQNVSKFTTQKVVVVRNGLKKKPGRPRKKHLIKTVFLLIPPSVRIRLILAIFAFMLLGYSLVFAKMLANLPSPSQLAPVNRPLTSQIYDRHGKLLYQFYDERNRKLVRLNDLPPHLIHATIAIEDKRFFAHPGIDPIGIIRALKLNLAPQVFESEVFNRESQTESAAQTRGGPTLQGALQGGSTITQQLIKNTLLTPDQTISRKAKEIFLAFWAERIYSKNEILQMYFNEAPYGGPAWGIETAAEIYFAKSAKDLSLAESAYLSGLPAAPTEYSPFGIYPEKGKERQREVLRRMVEDRYISQEEANRALLEKLIFKTPVQDIKAPHFVMYVRSVLAAKYGEKAVSEGGLKVITTLDLDMQEMAENVVAEEVARLKNLKVQNGAAMITDARNGQILSMVGSKDYFDSQSGNFNVTLALRQPGSSIKPITYATAFKKGFTPGTMLLDTPTTFPNLWGKPYSPVNYDSRFHGPVTIRTALGSSYNVPAVKILAMVGLPDMLQTAREMGITTLKKIEDYGLSLTLGGGGVKLLEMMSVYGTLAAEGIKYQPNPILQVTDPSGNILEDHRQAEGKRVLTKEVAYLLNNILSDNNARAPAFGINSQLNIPRHTVAAKTGTSDDKRDNWTFGFTPEFVVGTWVGNNDNSPMDPQLTSGITGATPIWHNIMVSLLADRPDIAFSRPAGIVETTTDGRNDLAISGQIPKTVIGYRKEKQKDETGEEKEVTIFTDPFSTFTPTKSAQVLPLKTTQ